MSFISLTLQLVSLIIYCVLLIDTVGDELKQVAGSNFYTATNRAHRQIVSLSAVWTEKREEKGKGEGTYPRRGNDEIIR
jgi:hypothetical protein